MNVVFRVDGGTEIGYGHLMRASAVAAVLLERGIDVTVATTTPSAARESFPDGIDTVSLPDRSDPEPLCQWLATNDAAVVYSDAYPVQTDYQREIRRHTKHVAFEDYAAYPIAADALINNNLYASGLDYSFAGPEPETYFGPKYALLREPIRQLTDREPPRRTTPERAVVTMGGSDTTEETPAILRAFDRFDGRVEAIVGPGFDESLEERVRTAATEVETEVSVVRDPDDLADRLFAADFAVTTASSTTFELFALGTPGVIKPVVDHQERIADEIADRDLGIVLDRDAGTDAFRRAIERYVTDPSLREEKQAAGRALVDGRGGVRVVDVITDL